ncbi:MAG: DUF2240 family protein [Thermoplasmatota archaeon]
MAKEDLKYTLAFIFQREGVEDMRTNDFIYGPAVELGWFSTKDARKVLDISKKEGLIRIEDDNISLTFNPKKVDVPLGFEPSDDLFEEERKKDVFTRLLNEIVKSSSLKREEIMSRVNKKQDRLNIEIEAALLLVSKELNLDLQNEEEYFKEIENKILGIEY